MRLSLLAVGKLSARDPESDLITRYRQRLRWTLDVREVDQKADQPDREAQALIRHVPQGAMVVLLDERGRQMDSVAFARALEGWALQGPVAFVIGGASGHGAEMRALGRAQMSLGPMTLPHMLARAVLVEQIYRAQTILDGHPYHRA